MLLMQSDERLADRVRDAFDRLGQHGGGSAGGGMGYLVDVEDWD